MLVGSKRSVEAVNPRFCCHLDSWSRSRFNVLLRIFRCCPVTMNDDCGPLLSTLASNASIALVASCPRPAGVLSERAASVSTFQRSYVWGRGASAGVASSRRLSSCAEAICCCVSSSCSSNALNPLDASSRWPLVRSISRLRHRSSSALTSLSRRMRRVGSRMTLFLSSITRSGTCLTWGHINVASRSRLAASAAACSCLRASSKLSPRHKRMSALRCSS